MTDDHRDDESRETPGDSTSTSEGLRGWLRRRGGALLRRLGVLLLLSVVLLAATIHFGIGMGLVVPFALERVVPQGWSVAVGSVEGRWSSRLELSGVTLEGPDVSLTAERVLVRYRLSPLLQRTAAVDLLAVHRPVFEMTRDTVTTEPGDSTDTGSGGMASLLAGEPVGGWTVRLDSVRIADGLARIRTPADRSLYELSAFRMSGGVALGANGLAVAVDTLTGDFLSVLDAPADSAFRSAGRLGLAGSLDGGDLNLETLFLTSDRSDVSGGGRIVFVPDSTLVGDMDLEVRAEPLDLRDLPAGLPDALMRDPLISGRVGATGTPDSLRTVLSVERGSGQERLEGEAVLRPRPSASGPSGVEGPPALEGSVRFEALDLDGWTPAPFDGAASGDVSFTVQSLGAGAAYRGEGTLRHRPVVADPSRLLARPLQARFEARGRLAGDSADAEPPFVDASVELEAGPPHGATGRITARVDGTRARWTADLALDSGRAEGNGTVDWGGDELVTAVERLRLRRFDLSAVDTVYPPSRITGEAEARVRGTSPERLRGEVRLTLAPSSVAELRADTLTLSSTLRGWRYQGRVAGRSEMGDLRSRYVVELRDTVVHFDADSLSYVRPDSAAEAPPVGEVHGRASGTWVMSERRRATLRATVDSARWSGADFSRVRIDGSLDGERVVADVDGAAAGLAPTPLQVDAHADVRGLALPELEGSMRLAVRRRHAGDSTRVDSVHVRAQAPRPGHVELEGSAYAAGGGALDFSGTADAASDSLRFDLRADGGAPAPVDLLGGAVVDSLSIQAAGRRMGTRWRDIRADVDVRSARWRDLEASAAVASFRYDSLGVRLDTLHVHSNVLEATGSGRLPVGGGGGRMAVQARLLDLEPVRSLSGLEVLAAADGTLEASASGSLDSLSWRTDVALEAVVANEVRLTGVRLVGDGRASAPYDFLLGLSDTELELTLDRISLPASEVRTVRTTLAGGSDSVRVEVDAVVDGRRDAFALVHVDPRADRRRARIDDLRFRLDRDEWRLVQDAVVEYGSGVTVEPVLLRADEQEIRIEGGVSEDGVFDLNARMDSTDVGTVADLAGFPRLRGWLSGRIRVQGPTDALEAWLDASGAFHREGRPPGPVEMTVRANGRRARGSLRLAGASRGSLEVGGGLLFPSAEADAGTPQGSNGGVQVPDTTLLGLRTDSLDVTVAARDFDLRWTEAFFTAEQLASLTGILEGELSLRGSSRSPRMEGRLGLRNGSASPTALGVRWDSIAISVHGEGASLVVDTARISAASGRVDARGTIGVTGALPLDLDVSLADFQAIRTDAYRAVVSGELQVGGMALAPDIDGGLRLASLDVFLDERVTSEGLEPVELTDADLEMLRQRFGVVPDATAPVRPLADRITADLEVVLGRDSWLRKRTSPEMAVPFSGTMDVTLRPGQPPRLAGSVEVTPGRGFVEQFGRRFELSEGTVTFNGPPEATRVDLTATYTVPSHDNPDDAEVTIILQVEGTQSDLGLTLSSDPTMENADIVSYIATGRPAAGSLTFQGQDSNGGLVAAGTDFALSQMTSVIESAAARRVGLDVVEIRREGLRQATLVAGKYVSPRLYVGFAQPVSLQEGDGLSFGSEGQSELEIEYEALRWLILNLEGSGSSIRFFLRGRRAY